MILPPWYEWLHGKIGLKEFAGPADNPAVTKLWVLARVPAIPAFSEDETPWCAAAVGAALFETGQQGTKSGMARSYASHSALVRLRDPVLGAITVIERDPPKPPFAHVALLAGGDVISGKIALLGGNQGDSVNISTFAARRVIGHFWPVGVLIRPEWQRPAMPVAAQAGGSVS